VVIFRIASMREGPATHSTRHRHRLLSYSALLRVFVVLSLALCSSPAFAQAAKYPFSIEGRVVAVTDGDTIKVLRGKELSRVRLNGIDAPEIRQAFGKKSKGFLSALVFGKDVEVIVRDTDRYGRLVGDVLVGGKSANFELVAAGLAWQYTEYSKDRTLAELEKGARGKRLGLWADRSPLPPWEFRRLKTRKP
jgi:micrococcal nuclease